MFQNNRKRKQSELPEVKVQRAKYGRKETKKETDEGAKMYGLKNYKPGKLESEDEESTKYYLATGVL